MLIISGKIYVDEDKRDEYVAKFKDLMTRARKQPGCLDLVIAIDLLEADRINNYEAWESEEHLADWRKVTNAPNISFDKERSDVQKHQVNKLGSSIK